MFPDFNIYSSPLLILIVQGLILSGLLLWLFKATNNLPNLILGVLLINTCYHRTTYTAGFMGWYDKFRNTKINYFLVTQSFATGPLIYLYIKPFIIVVCLLLSTISYAQIYGNGKPSTTTITLSGLEELDIQFNADTTYRL